MNKKYINFKANSNPTVISFNGYSCFATYGKYNNGHIAVQLIGKGSGEPIAVATINVPNIFVDNDEILVKEYSENKGMIEALVNAGIIEEPHQYLNITFSGTKVGLAKLKVNPEEEKEILRRYYEKYDKAS